MQFLKLMGKLRLTVRYMFKAGRRVKTFAMPIGEKSFDAESLDSVDNILISKAESPWVNTQIRYFSKNF